MAPRSISVNHGNRAGRKGETDREEERERKREIGINRRPARSAARSYAAIGTDFGVPRVRAPVARSRCKGLAGLCACAWRDPSTG